jgi:hypothetical protein
MKVTLAETTENQELPGVEFEGPMGHFWLMEEVPTAALIKGKLEIEAELKRRTSPSKSDFRDTKGT